MLHEIVTKQTKFENFEVGYDFPGIGVKTMLLNARHINQDGNKSKLILLAIEDITAKRGSERQMQMQELNEKILNAHEEERKRVAGELHDSIGQSLAAMQFRVDGWVQEMHEQGNETGKSALEAVSEMVRNIATEIRRIQQDLRPSLLDHLGILATIKWFCREFQTTYPGIRIEQQIGVQEDEVSPSVKIVIFRIMQEALNNIAKHSNAKCANVSLVNGGDRIELIISDDGVGMDLDFIHQTRVSRLGLTSMRERTERTGGEFSIESTPGEGTIIRACWPT